MEGLTGFGILIALILLIVLAVILAVVGFIVLSLVGGILLIILGIVLLVNFGVIGGFLGGILILVGAIWTWLVWSDMKSGS